MRAARRALPRGWAHLALLVQEELVEVGAVSLADADEVSLGDEAPELVAALHVEPFPQGEDGFEWDRRSVVGSWAVVARHTAVEGMA